MSGVGVDNNLNRQKELYQRSIEDNRRNHKEELENLKNSHVTRTKKQSENHVKQIGKIEEDFSKTTDRIKNDQKRALVEKNDLYDRELAKNKNQFHEQKKENIRNWDKKFSELKTNFDSNMETVKKVDQDVRDSLSENYKSNVKEIRQTANKDLDLYLDSTKQAQKELNLKIQAEKNDLIKQNEKTKNALLQTEKKKRDFIERNAVKDSQDARELQTKRYIDGKNLAELKFEKMNNDVNGRISDEIITREDATRAKQVLENRQNNVKFSERYDDLSNQYNADVRKLAHKQRVEALADNEIKQQLDDNFKENMKNQVDLQKETLINERNNLDKKYAKILDRTVDSFQESIRNQNLVNSEKIIEMEGRLGHENRQNQFQNKLDQERFAHDHSVAMNFSEQRNSLTQSDMRKSSDLKVKSMKESFNKSLEKAQNQARKNFEVTRDSMLEDKKVLERRLHEQNSNQNAFIKGLYADKIEKLSQGYEKKIQALELQNKMLVQNSHDSLRDVIRGSNNEIERQRKGFEKAAQTRIESERALSKEREDALNDKIQHLEKNFTAKMNEQTLLGRQRLKDATFALEQKANQESSRYQDIISQNQKFMAREIQRLKIASDTDRQRLVTQYEDRIQQLQRVYNQKNEELKNYNELNKA